MVKQAKENCDIHPLSGCIKRSTSEDTEIIVNYGVNASLILFLTGLCIFCL